MMVRVAEDAARQDEGRVRGTGGRRSVARLAAVQALYQLELNPELSAGAVVREFVLHRFGEEIDGDRLAEADANFFADIVEGAAADRVQLDAEISAALVEDWPLTRLDAVLRAILRAGTWELMQRRDVPPRVSISEYTGIAHAFFAGKEPGFANGVLDRLGRLLRGDEM
jgi:transcription antitermination protein NusB